MGNPVLVTGIIRSGTTWVGRVLRTTLETIYIHEPFNVDSNWNACFPTPINFYYISNENGGPYLDRCSRLLELRPIFKGKWREKIEKINNKYIENQFKNHNSKALVPILKDPMALYSVEWLVDNFKVEPVIIIRHPIGIIKSLLRLGWSKKFNFSYLTIQPQLLKRFYDDENIREIKEIVSRNETLTVLERTAYFVRFSYFPIVRYFEEYPNWNFLVYEKLVNHPENEFFQLIEKLSLKPSKVTLRSISNDARGEYNPLKAHQDTIRPIKGRDENIFKPDNNIDNCKEVFDNFFADINERLSMIVDWLP